MDIPSGLLEKLHCDICKNYLSCGPIHLNYKTNRVSCGRCTPKKRSSTCIRYVHYETLASILSFPCRNAKHGCPKKLLFSCENTQKHETNCEYKKRGCPMLSCSKQEPHLRCKWTGRLATLLHHCKISHADKVLENPCMFEHDFTDSMHDTFLIPAFDSLFLVNVTICKEISINCCLIGDERKTKHFKYTVTTVCTKSEQKLIRDGVVRGENTGNVNDVHLCASLLDGDTTAHFKLTIEYNSTSDIVKAVDIVSEKTHLCCFNKNGCSYTDTSAIKCKKHELYFCKYILECPECSATIEKQALYTHLIKCHGALKARNGRAWHISEGYKQYCVLLGDDDHVYLCKFSLACYRLLLTVFSEFAMDELKHVSCEIRINDPGNCYKHRLMPKCELNACYDWTININMYNYPMWRHYGLDLFVSVGQRGKL